MSGFQEIGSQTHGTNGNHFSTSRKTEFSSESHISTVTPTHPALLPSEAVQVGGGYNSQGQSGGPMTPQLSPRPAQDSLASGTTSYLPSGSVGSQAPSSMMYEGSASGIPTPGASSGVVVPNADGNPYGSTGVMQGAVSRLDGVQASNKGHGDIGAVKQNATGIQPESHIDQNTSGKMAGSTFSPGGSTFEPGCEGDATGTRQQGVKPTTTVAGTSSVGHAGGERASGVDKASIGGGGVNAANTPTNTPTSGLGSGGQVQGQGQAQSGAQGYLQQAKETAAPYLSNVQETGRPYVAKVQEATGPYVAKVQETVGPYVTQAQEAASPYVGKVRDLGNSALESTRPVINQASQAATNALNTAAEGLEARGVNLDTTKQKLADAGQAAKDYGTVGQQKAGEYLQQAVDQASNMDRENKGIIATIFGTVLLVWLAFGFSLLAMLSLGVAAAIAAILTRFTRKRVSAGEGPKTPSSLRSESSPVSSKSAESIQQKDIPGVETHYPRPAHPDNSLNNAAS